MFIILKQLKLKIINDMENNKINIAEILKDCPTGMKLNCTIYENVEFDIVDKTPEVIYPIHCLIKTNAGYESLLLTCNGCTNRHPNAKCVIFPEDKTTWEGFVPPCTFKDGDIVATSNGDFIGITTGVKEGKYLQAYCICTFDNTLTIYPNEKEFWIFDRLATEKEKQKLLKVIEENSYKWNKETKTLEEKLIEPKFKAGDKIRRKNTNEEVVIIKVGNRVYHYYVKNSNFAKSIKFTEQDDWELIPNRFDLSILSPFTSKVLVRDFDNQIWKPAIFGYYIANKRHYMTVGGITYLQLIPYENNEYLLGSTEDCKDYYKTWKE
jgi:hypothetical protein